MNLIIGSAYFSSKFARKKIQETIKLLLVGTIFHPKSIILVDVLKNKFEFSFTALLVILITERRITISKLSEHLPSLPGHEFELVPTPLTAGGVGMFILKLVNTA